MFKKRNMQKLREEGLYVLKIGIEVQLEQFRWHKSLPDLSDGERKEYETIYHTLKVWNDKIQSAWNGELRLE